MSCRTRRSLAPRWRRRYGRLELLAERLGLPIRHHHPEDDVDDEPGPADERAEDEGKTQDRHRDPELLGEAGAHAGEHLPVARAVPGPRERVSSLEQGAAV